MTLQTLRLLPWLLTKCLVSTFLLSGSLIAQETSQEKSKTADGFILTLHSSKPIYKIGEKIELSSVLRSDGPVGWVQTQEEANPYEYYGFSVQEVLGSSPPFSARYLLPKPRKHIFRGVWDETLKFGAHRDCKNTFENFDEEYDLSKPGDYLIS